MKSPNNVRSRKKRKLTATTAPDREKTKIIQDWLPFHPSNNIVDSCQKQPSVFCIGGSDKQLQHTFYGGIHKIIHQLDWLKHKTLSFHWSGPCGRKKTKKKKQQAYKNLTSS